MCASFTQDETLEETGWKLVHGDVFRPPRFPMLLVSCVGSGIQLFAATFIVIGALNWLPCLQTLTLLFIIVLRTACNCYLSFI